MRGHGVLFFLLILVLFFGGEGERGKGCDGVAAHSTGGEGDGGGKTAARRGGLGEKGERGCGGEGGQERGAVRGVWVMRWSMTWG